MFPSLQAYEGLPENGCSPAGGVDDPKQANGAANGGMERDASASSTPAASKPRRACTLDPIAMHVDPWCAAQCCTAACLACQQEAAEPCVFALLAGPFPLRFPPARVAATAEPPAPPSPPPRTPPQVE